MNQKTEKKVDKEIEKQVTKGKIVTQRVMYQQTELTRRQHNINFLK